MKNAVYLLVCLFILTACGSKKKTTASKPSANNSHNSQNSLDWAGIYTGKLPCADCAGIKTEIEINSDLTYTMRTQYEGKSDTVFVQQGKFEWNEDGSEIRLSGLDQSHLTQYLVGENLLFQLDQSGTRISGDLAERYQLHRVSATLTDTYWKLQEINGQDILPNATRQKEAFLKMDESAMRFSGYGGCNNLMGTYQSDPENRITFSDVASTRMACPDNTTEDTFIKVLPTVTHFSLENKSLQLLDGEQNTVAVFRADYLKSVE